MLTLWFQCTEYLEGNLSPTSVLRWLVRHFVCKKQEAKVESHTQLDGAAAPHNTPPLSILRVLSVL